MGKEWTPQGVSTHSRLKAAGTALNQLIEWVVVSTHSRLKAAGYLMLLGLTISQCFNTQPPEGGWAAPKTNPVPTPGFNTQPPEGGWAVSFIIAFPITCFNTQPPEGGWTVLI